MFSRKATLVLMGLSVVAFAPSARAAGPDVDAFVPVAPSREGLPGSAELRSREATGIGSVFDERGTLRLAWLDPAEASGRSATGARDEAARLFRAMGITVSWRRSSVAEASRPGEVRVILLDRAAVNERRASVLGSTPARFEGAPFVWIHVPGVRQALGLAPGAAASELPDSYRLGTALGRVIAHEVVHALAPSVPHGEGLMKSRLTRADLTSASAPVTPELVTLVREALAGVPGPARPDTGLLAAEHARGEQPR